MTAYQELVDAPSDHDRRVVGSSVARRNFRVGSAHSRIRVFQAPYTPFLAYMRMRHDRSSKTIAAATLGPT